ncbi:MAG TPA: hypothetical protein VGS10_09670 [Terracidiphilus sp.]|nr:hypothetical protein [Terracidiphilus sp.]
MQNQFSPENIQKIFGHEAAEDEDVNRIREYYFKTKVFDQIRADLPLRILVGHKGMGKSALFKIAMEEERNEGQLPILLRPNDVVGIEPEAGFLSRIKEWKYGLQSIIAQKSFDTFGIKQEGKLGEALHAAGKTLGFIRDTIRPYSESKVDLSPPGRHSKPFSASQRSARLVERKCRSPVQAFITIRCLFSPSNVRRID